jgi:hypothetical protein
VLAALYNSLRFQLAVRRVRREKGPEGELLFRLKYEMIVKERRKTGQFFYIPFITKDIAINQDEETDEFYEDNS